MVIRKLLILYGVECFISFSLISFGLFNINTPLYAIIVAIVFTIEFLFNLLLSDDTQRRSIILFFIFAAAFLVRIYYIYYDINIQEIDPGDCHDFRVSAENFFYTNRFIFRNREDFSGTTLIMGMICKVFGPHRMIIQYFNSLCFMGASFITYSLLQSFKVDFQWRILILTWMMFSPQNIKNTSISNREGFISLFIVLSLFFFKIYIDHNRIYDLIYSISFILLSALLHSGTIGILVGYIFYLSLYDRNSKIFMINLKSVILFIFFAVSFYYLYTTMGDMIFEKISGVENIEDITSHNRSKGGASYYVPGTGVTSFGGMLLYSPIRAVFFLLSPLPWNWRGISDIIAFIACSSPQLIIAFLTIKNFKFIRKEDKALFIVLLVSAISVSFIFGWTAGNAGTDIRHRDKFLSIYSCMLGIMLSTQEKRTYELSHSDSDVNENTKKV